MTDEELRELDAWIVEHAFEIEVAYDANGEPYNAQGGIGGMITSWISHYSNDARSFRRVKREIERRGWSWVSSSPCDRLLKYSFHIFNTDRSLGFAEAETEELAGCLALKEAVESNKDDS